MLCSKPLDDEKKVTAIILDALRETGQRGIISRGWGALGSCKLPGLVFVTLQLSPLFHIQIM
jgi:sterol 3beta-glucosyltransferase